MSDSDDILYLQEYLALCERRIGNSLTNDEARSKLQLLNERFGHRISYHIRKDSVLGVQTAPARQEWYDSGCTIGQEEEYEWEDSEGWSSSGGPLC